MSQTERERERERQTDNGRQEIENHLIIHDMLPKEFINKTHNSNIVVVAMVGK